MVLRHLASRLALVICSLLISLAAVEFTGRTAGLWQPSRTFQYNVTRGYELTPNVADVNALGLRGGPIEAARLPGVGRVIVLGDSFTYGDGVRANEALPAQLELQLNQKGNARYEVLNFGVPGYNTAQEFAYLQEAGLALHPDLVIVAFNLSDADFSPLRNQSRSHVMLVHAKEFLKAHVGFYDFARLQFRGMQEWSFRNDPATAVWPEMYPIRLAARGEPSRGWDQCRAALQGIAQTCRRAGIPVVMVFWPVLERLSDYPYRSEHTFVTTQAKALGIPVLDLLPVFAGADPRALTVSARNPHPNAAAHRAAAIAVAAFLQAPSGQAPRLVKMAPSSAGGAPSM